MEADCLLKGERARFLTGRLDLGSAEVGMDSGIGSDMSFLLEKMEVTLRLERKIEQPLKGTSSGLTRDSNR